AGQVCGGIGKTMLGEKNVTRRICHLHSADDKSDGSGMKKSNIQTVRNGRASKAEDECEWSRMGKSRQEMNLAGPGWESMQGRCPVRESRNQ
ncbi:MAG TPA: hypothetical protein PK600_08645, partial [Deltaproteobacteria bacterium]|nr:hypothetical protein [Deltaproteobacteria bacterium]